MRSTIMLVLVSSVMVAGAAADGLPPFRITYEVPSDGLSAIAIDDAEGIRVKNVEALIPRPAGAAQVAWDLKDDFGNYVEPGTYRFKTLVMPRPELYYRHTVSPNIENYWDDRVPWYTSHSGVHGWASDFGGTVAIATGGERVYFGAGSSEAGQAFTEIDLGGKRHWGFHWFGGWIGLRYLTADKDAVYVIDTADCLWRMTAEPRREMKKIKALDTETRRGYANALAARGGELFISFAPYRVNGLGHVTENNLFDNATLETSVDADNSVPLYEANPRQSPDDRLKPNPRHYFLRLLRLPTAAHSDWSTQNSHGTPSGQFTGGQGPRRFNAYWPNYLQTHPGTEARQHIVVAFKQAAPIGSLAFPYPVDPQWFSRVEFSVLKPGAPYPPRPNEEGDWQPFDSLGRPGAWNVVAAPAGTVTRALRVTFNRSDALAVDAEWLGWMEGMKILNRRFVNHVFDAKIRVNSGSVDEFGVWDAERKAPVTRENPGIYVMEWQKSRKISGLAFQEVDGAITEIDVWAGPANVPVSLEGDKYWRNVAVYRQARRDHYGGGVDHVHNAEARYLDGYVDIRDDGKHPVVTRAIRLRVVEQWMHPGMRHLMGVRPDRGGRTLDTRRCRIFGVAAVEHLGGEIIDERMYERLAVYNAVTGEPLREFPFSVAARSLHFHPDGRLMALNASRDRLIAIDTDTGATTELMRFTQPPQQITFGPDGRVYAFAGDTHHTTWHEHDYAPMGGHRHMERPVRDPAVAPFRVYELNGRRIKEIGTPGRIEAGLWDSTRVGLVSDMTVDRQGSLWVATGGSRLVRFDTKTGKMSREFFGNTTYGGGGSFNRYDASRVFFGDAQFTIDDTTHHSQMYSQMGTAGGSYVAVRVNGRTYLADAPLKLGKIPSDYVNIYLYDEKSGSARRVAAFGNALEFDPVRQGNIIGMLGGQAPLGFSFTWSDLNGNGEVDPDVSPIPRGWLIRRLGNAALISRPNACRVPACSRPVELQ